MARQPVVAGRAEQLLGSSVIATAPVAGGDICTAVKLRLSSGRTAFLKTLTGAPAGFFEAEATGLRWLAEVDDGAATPDVLGVADDCLILGWVESGRPGPDAAAAFGRALARTHMSGAPSYGLDTEGFIGRLPLRNRPMDTWTEFYAERRIAPYLKVARDRGVVGAADAETIERAVARVGEIVPDEPPARLHGDLWNGNVLFTNDDRVVVIDPAAYGGHREVDLAMLALFGLPQLPHVMAAYEEEAPLAEGWEDRLAIHQLFPLLVHACLFGGQYGARASRLAARYVCGDATAALRAASQYTLSLTRHDVRVSQPTAVKHRVLVVDDDRAVRESLRRSLEFNGYDVQLAADGAEALAGIGALNPDLVVMDVMMPRLDGLEATRALRAAGNDVPVIVLTARDAVGDRVEGLDAGADDYLTKPFALQELLARIRALLRRATPVGDGDEEEVLSFADLTMNVTTRDVTRGGRTIELTRTEFTLLEMFLRRPRRVLDRSFILEEVWGYDFPTTANSLEVYVGYLRRKTESEGEPRLIHTVRGVGYVLKES